MNQRAYDYRLLWTWDSWVCDPFSAESFISEYCSLIDWMSESGYNGLIIWGFIDSRHGGVEAAQRVATYGRLKGVRILPGIGAGGYHGFSVSPGLPYNLDDLLKDDPELRGTPRDGLSHAEGFCARLHHPRFLKWLSDGAAWLAATFDIGGVNIETNEMVFIDISEGTEELTSREPNRLKYAASFSDLAAAVPLIHEQIVRLHPDSWTTYATYEPAWWHRQEDAWLLDNMPHDAIAQWNMEMDHSPTCTPPVSRNISLVHSGGWCYPDRAFPKTWAFTQYRCFLPLIEQMRQFGTNQAALGVNGFVLGNAGSHKAPDNEINYLAALDFASSPNLTMQQFATDRLAGLYGEAAVDSVMQLFLKQPDVHQEIVESWRWFANLLLNKTAETNAPAISMETISAAKAQVNLASVCLENALPHGKDRLLRILQVLKEYAAFAEMTTLPIFQQPNSVQNWHEAAISAAVDRGIELKYYLAGD